MVDVFLGQMDNLILINTVAALRHYISLVTPQNQSRL